jgi:hypothetical protein
MQRVWLATNPDGKLPTNQKIEGEEEEEEKEENNKKIMMMQRV